LKEELSLPINEKCKIAIIGLGYVGLPLAIEFSKNSNCLITGKKLERKVIGFDINKKRIDGLRNFYDYTNQFSKKELKDLKNIEFTLEEELLKEADIFIITVPTPIDEFNIPDLTALKEASTLVGKTLSKKTNKFKPIVIYESTVFPGATQDVCIPLLSKSSDLKLNEDYFCGYSPERINPGDNKHKLKDIKKITSGSNQETSILIDNLYGSIIEAGTHICRSIKIAETAKVIENTQRDLNIAFPDTISGTIIPSTFPQTLLWERPLILAASDEKIRSSAKGPSKSALFIFSEAQSDNFLAVKVVGMLSIRFSLADKNAIFGFSIPIL